MNTDKRGSKMSLHADPRRLRAHTLGLREKRIPSAFIGVYPWFHILL